MLTIGNEAMEINRSQASLGNSEQVENTKPRPNVKHNSFKINRLVFLSTPKCSWAYPVSVWPSNKRHENRGQRVVDVALSPINGRWFTPVSAF